jgi:ribosome-binding ATPase YchF (GTP1/OBG family)
MKIGLVGYPGTGKSTVFGALTGLDVATGFGAGKANLGAVKVPDARVDALAALYEPKKTTYAEITFSDLGVGKGEGLDRTALNRDAQRRCAVSGAARVSRTPRRGRRSARRAHGLETETLLADLELVEQRIAKLTKDRSNPRELALLERVKEALESERAVRTLGSPRGAEVARGLCAAHGEAAACSC